MLPKSNLLLCGSTTTHGLIGLFTLMSAEVSFATNEVDRVLDLLPGFEE